MIEQTSSTKFPSDESPYPLVTRDNKIDYIIEVREGFPGSQYLSEILEEARDESYLELISDDRNALYDKLATLQDNEFEHQFAEARNYVAGHVKRFCRSVDTDVLAKWMNKDAWSSVEALSLWLGLDPRFGTHLVAWAEKNERLAMAAAEIAQRWDLITRAMAVGELAHPFRPHLFLQWAQKKRALPIYFSELLADSASDSPERPDENTTTSQNRELRGEVDRLQKLLRELNQPHYKLSVKLFGAVCAGIYGYKPGKRNQSTRLITEITDMFIDNAPGEKTVRDYIRKSINELDKGDLEKLCSIYDEKSENLGKPELLHRNFPYRPEAFRTQKP